MSETPTVPPAVNKMMTFILRSPLHGLVSKSMLLITFTGLKTGKTYTTPVDYSQDGDVITIFTHGQWWKNLRGGRPVTLRLRGRDLQGVAEPVAGDPRLIAAALAGHLRRAPGEARFYHVTFDLEGNPQPDQVAEAAKKAILIQVRLC